MGMFINTNVMALNAQRNLGATSAQMGKALERLSSGMRINRAADDAAGLAISEKMRSQVRGMQQGLRNAQDGISMIQTAEGALSETHAILQRMRELAVQAGSTTLSTSDRQAIGDELLTLTAEIDNIAGRTRFNGLNLLTGSLSVTASGTVITNQPNDAADFVTVTVDANGADPSQTYTLSKGTGAADFTITASGGVAQTIAVADFTAAGQSQVLNFDALGIKMTLSITTFVDGITGAAMVDSGTLPLKSSALTLSGSGSASYRVGSESSDNVTVAYTDMRAAAIGSGGANDVADLVTDNNAVLTTTLADALLTSLDAAIGQVSTQRAKLGAAQNQMESAINSLGVSVENLSASESRIRDADIASVSSDLVTRQIMQQAGVAVLAQANTAPQSVLSLLRQ